MPQEPSTFHFESESVLLGLGISSLAGLTGLGIPVFIPFPPLGIKHMCSCLQGKHFSN